MAALQELTRYLRDVPAIPVDYYVVFSEIERQLSAEFDFIAEAEAMEREVLAALREVLGARHPRTLAAMNNLATPCGIRARRSQIDLLLSFARSSADRWGRGGRLLTR